MFTPAHFLFGVASIHGVIGTGGVQKFRVDRAWRHRRHVGDHLVRRWNQEDPPRAPMSDKSESAEFSRLQLLLGDSVARDSGLKPADISDEILFRARGGATCISNIRHLQEDLAVWRAAASAFGMSLGQVIVWPSGNDVYRRFSGLPGAPSSRALAHSGKRPWTPRTLPTSLQRPLAGVPE